MVQIKKTTALDFDAKIKYHGFASKWNVAVCNSATRAREDMCEQFRLLGNNPESVTLQRVRDSVTAYLSALGGVCLWVEVRVGLQATLNRH